VTGAAPKDEGSFEDAPRERTPGRTRRSSWTRRRAPVPSPFPADRRSPPSPALRRSGR